MYEYNPKIGMTIAQIATAVNVIINTQNTDVLVKFWSGDILIPKENKRFLQIFRILDYATN